MQSPQTLNARAEYCRSVAILRQQGLQSARSGHYRAVRKATFRTSRADPLSAQTPKTEIGPLQTLRAAPAVDYRQLNPGRRTNAAAYSSRSGDAVALPSDRGSYRRDHPPRLRAHSQKSTVAAIALRRRLRSWRITSIQYSAGLGKADGLPTAGARLMFSALPGRITDDVFSRPPS